MLIVNPVGSGSLKKALLVWGYIVSHNNGCVNRMGWQLLNKGTLMQNSAIGAMF